MSDYPDLELHDDLAALAVRFSYLNGQRAEIDAELVEIKAKLRSAISIGQRALVNGVPVVAVSANRRFDPEMAQAKLSPDLVALCMSRKFDSAQAKAVLPPALYDSCKIAVGEPVVRAL